MTTITNKNANEIGLVKNISIPASDIINDCLRLFSANGPRTKARTNAAGGYPYIFINKPIIPKNKKHKYFHHTVI